MPAENSPVNESSPGIPSPLGPQARDHLLITVHGIRTFGQWQERLEEALIAEDNTLCAIHYKYGYFSAIAFLIPFLRFLVLRRFARELQSYCKQRSWKRIDIVAHSFGTYLVANALLRLKQQDRPQVNTLILAGSVLKVNFPVERLLSSCVTRVLNECGIRDAVLLLSQIVSLGTGMAGRSGIVGFQQEKFQNRFYDFGHGGYFDTGGAFFRREWLPLLLYDNPILRRPYPGALSNTRGVSLFLANNADGLKLAVVLTVCITGIRWYRDTRIADEIVRCFYQGDPKQEYAGLWRLSTIPSEHVKRLVVVELLNNKEGVKTFGHYDLEFATAFGLNSRTIAGLKGILKSEPCKDLDRVSFEGCRMIAQTSGDTLAFSNHILDVLPDHKWKPAENDIQDGMNLESYSEELSGRVRNMVPRMEGAQPALADHVLKVIETLGSDDILATENLLAALEILFPKLPEAQREEVANRLVVQLSKADNRYALDLAYTLTQAGPSLKGNQLETAMKRFVDLYAAAGRNFKASGRRELFQLRDSQLPSALNPGQAEAVDEYIEMLRKKLTAQDSAESAALCLAEAKLASGGQLTPTIIENGVNTTLTIAKSIAEQARQEATSARRQTSQSRRPLPSKLVPFFDPLETWATIANGQPAEKLASQLLAWTPQVPMLASSVSQLAPKITDENEDLGPSIAALLPKLEGTAKMNLALALVALGAKTHIRHDWADLGFRELVLELASTPAPVLEAVSSEKDNHFNIAQRQELADRVATSLKSANAHNVGMFAEALYNLGDADSRNIQHMQAACDRMLELVAEGQGGESAYLGKLLAKLGPRLPEDSLEDLATRLETHFLAFTNSAHPMSDPNLVPMHDSNGAIQSYPAWTNSLYALDAMASSVTLHGNQTQIAVNGLMDLMQRACRDITEAARARKAVKEYPDWDSVMVPMLAGLVKALSAHLTPEQKAALVSRILDLVSMEIDMAGTIKPLTANIQLTPLLASLTPALRASQINLAQRITHLRNNAQEPQKDELSDGLLGLAANANSADRKRVLMAVIGEPRPAACDVAVTRAKSGELPLLVDMLKWPICAGSRSGVALQILRLKSADPVRFGRFGTLNDSKTFRIEWMPFVSWLKEQKDNAGKPLNVERPPLFTPLNANQAAVSGL